jgi:Flp pilus assembly protein CpaB
VEKVLPKGMLSTPRRTVIAGVVALVLAAILLLVYLSHYRNSVKSANSNVPVLRSKVFIPAGTTALALAQKGSFEVATVPKGELKTGAVTDASALHGEVALHDIYPGQQLTATDFGVTATSSALSGSSELLGVGRTTGAWRAISVSSLDAEHGISPQAQTGDSVDVYVQMSGALVLLMQNVLILQAPGQVATGTTAPTSQTYILRVPTKLTPKFLFAVQNGTLWFALRPQKGAKPAGRGPVTSDTFFRP